MDIDVTVIIGNLVLEKSKSPKLLLLRFHSMATGAIDNNVANTLYETLRCLAGKSGFEVNRVGGSNGLRTKATDTTMRLLAHVVPSLLPRRLGACLVIPHSGGYYFIYRRHRDMKNQKLSRMALFHYSPPQAGGSFQFNMRSFFLFPILAEFTYMKMMAVCLIHRINLSRENKGQMGIATGPIQSEMDKIKEARLAFNKCNGSISVCLDAFNSFNSASLVTHPVGLHNDTFRSQAESIENKMLITVNDPNITGQGGSWFRKHNQESKVVAILDWDGGSRNRRCYVAENTDIVRRELNMGPGGMFRITPQLRLDMENNPYLQEDIRRWMRRTNRNEQNISQTVVHDLESRKPNTTSDTDGELNVSLLRRSRRLSQIMNSDHGICATGIRPASHGREQIPKDVGACNIIGGGGQEGGCFGGIDGRKNTETGRSDIYDDDINLPRDNSGSIIQSHERMGEVGLPNVIQSKKPEGKTPLNIVIIRRITINKKTTLEQMILGKNGQRRKNNKP